MCRKEYATPLKWESQAYIDQRGNVIDISLHLRDAAFACFTVTLEVRVGHRFLRAADGGRWTVLGYGRLEHLLAGTRHRETRQAYGRNEADSSLHAASLPRVTWRWGAAAPQVKVFCAWAACARGRSGQLRDPQIQVTA